MTTSSDPTTSLGPDPDGSPSVTTQLCIREGSLCNPTDDSAALPRGLPTVQTVMVSVTVAALGILLMAPAGGGSAGALATVGFVLVEAVGLYVGYGAVTRAVGSVAREVRASA